jgi:hypothetical protein
VAGVSRRHLNSGGSTFSDDGFGRAVGVAAKLIILVMLAISAWGLVTVGIPGLSATGRMLAWLDFILGLGTYVLLAAARRYRRQVEAVPDYWRLLLSTEPLDRSERRIRMLERGATACWVALAAVLLCLGLGVSRGFLLR